MTIFRHKITGRLYKLFEVSPRQFTGRWFESEDLFTGTVRKLNASSWKRNDFIPVATR
jgi:hypothetical protein